MEQRDGEGAGECPTAPARSIKFALPEVWVRAPIRRIQQQVNSPDIVRLQLRVERGGGPDSRQRYRGRASAEFDFAPLWCRRGCSLVPWLLRLRSQLAERCKPGIDIGDSDRVRPICRLKQAAALPQPLLRLVKTPRVCQRPTEV